MQHAPSEFGPPPQASLDWLGLWFQHVESTSETQQEENKRWLHQEKEQHMSLTEWKSERRGKEEEMKKERKGRSLKRQKLKRSLQGMYHMLEECWLQNKNAGHSRTLPDMGSRSKNYDFPSLTC